MSFLDIFFSKSLLIIGSFDIGLIFQNSLDSRYGISRKLL